MFGAFSLRAKDEHPVTRTKYNQVHLALRNFQTLGKHKWDTILFLLKVFSSLQLSLDLSAIQLCMQMHRHCEVYRCGLFFVFVYISICIYIYIYIYIKLANLKTPKSASYPASQEVTIKCGFPDQRKVQHGIASAGSCRFLSWCAVAS